MNTQEFLQNFAAEFEMTEPEEITMRTNFRKLDEWDSLQGLAIIGMAHNKYGVLLTGAEVKDSETVQELYDIISSRII